MGVLAGVVDDGDALALLLERLGLPTLGDLAGLAEASVLARFGVDGARAHRLARGLAEHTAPPVPPPPDLAEACEFDPPAERVDEAAFAIKGLADQLLSRLDALGLSCTHVVVEAETEHGDPATEQLVHTALGRLLDGRTGIIVAHRLATVAYADDILVLEDGQVREHGPRLALAADPTSRFAGLLRVATEEVSP